MKKRKSIKEQLISTTQSSKIATEKRLKELDLNERINKAEGIVNSGNKEKPKIEKVIRDAFTLQFSDIEKLKHIKWECLQAGLEVNKSLIVRAGIQALSSMSLDQIRDILYSLPKVKIGRPK